MSRSRVKNIAASVRYRLLEMARRSGRSFNERLLYYAIERFLYRLSRSPHSGKFVLKGEGSADVHRLERSAIMP